MSSDNTRRLILEHVNGTTTLGLISEIARFHRIKASREYHQALDLIRERLAGLPGVEVRVESYPADGRTRTWDWVPSLGWSANSAELWLEGDERELLCSYDRTPLCLVTHSKKVDVTAELMDGGRGTSEELDKLDATGKLLLIEGLQYGRHMELMRTGAAGILSYPPRDRIAERNDLVAYDAYLPTEAQLAQIRFGFSLSCNQGLRLKAMVTESATGYRRERGPVLHAVVDAEFYASSLTTLEARIPGTSRPQESVVMIAHLCHPAPGANDNASGAAGLFESVRVLSRLIERGDIAPPERTIKFLWVNEYMGTVPWMYAHRSDLAHTVGCINLDMIGEDHVKLKSICCASDACWSSPSALNDLAWWVLELNATDPNGIEPSGTQDAMVCRATPFQAGSDHTLFNDHRFGIPGLMLGHIDDPFYHTSGDVPENCDPTELKRVAAAGCYLAYILASPLYAASLGLRGIVERGRSKREAVLRELIEDVAASRPNSGHYMDTLIRAWAEHEERILESLGDLSTSTNTARSEILNGAVHLMGTMKANTRCRRCGYLGKRYRSRHRGPATLEMIDRIETSREYAVLGSGRRCPVSHHALSLELYNLAATGRPVEWIAATASLEFANVYLPDEIHAYLEVMKRAGMLSEDRRTQESGLSFG